MSNLKYTAIQSATTVLSTELNSLANDGNSLSSAISNDGSSERFLYCMIEVSLAAQSTARSAGAHIAIYFLPTIDGGTTYSYGDNSTDPSPGTLVATLPLDASTSARVVTIYGVQLPPSDFKILLENKTGQAFASSNNTLKIAQYGIETV